MKDDLRRTAEAIFHEVVDQPPARQSALLDERCGSLHTLRSEVEQLLRASDDVMGDFLCMPTFVAAPRACLPPPDRIGKYRIDRQIGEGSMGLVFAARQEHPDRRVALKLLRPGLIAPRLLRRFHDEVEALATLNHTGIAHIYEAGSAELDSAGGRFEQPYFTMELIEGEPLTGYVRRSQLGLRARLELFAAVCDAVQHAHQNGIIHRDLKPANILVDNAGRPKVLDFGVARVTSGKGGPSPQGTLTGQVIGTLAYMSPEQARGDPAQVDARSDIYSLGVILYELLSGKLPHDLTGLPLHAATRTICESAPLRLASIDRAFRGDLDTIVSRAIEKEASRRYQSAPELVADLRRHLRNETVLARPASALYSFSRFARRNRGLVGGTALALAALLAGTFGTASFAWRASQQAERAASNETRALAAAARADAVGQMLLDVMRSPDPELVHGPGFTVRELLDDVSAQVNERFKDQPEIAAAVHATVGKTFRAIGLLEKSRRHLENALHIREERLGENHADVAESQRALAELLHECGELEPSDSLFTRALQTRQRMLGPEHPLVADVLVDLAALRADQRLHSQAESLCREALRIYRAAGGDDAPGVGACLDQLGYLARSERRYADAERYFRAALDHNRRRFGERHPTYFMSLKSLAALLRITKRFEEAEALYQESLSGVREWLGPDHPQVAAVLNSLANLRVRQRRFEEGAAHFQEALAIYQKSHAGDSVSVAVCLSNYSLLLAQQSEPARAAEVARQALEIRRRLHPESNEKITIGICTVATHLAAAGDVAAAAELCRDGIQRARELETNDRWILGRRLYDFGRLLTAHGGPSHEGMVRLRESEAALLEAQDIASKHYAENRWRTHWLAASLASLYDKRSEPDVAARWRAVAVAARPVADSPSDSDD